MFLLYVLFNLIFLLEDKILIDIRIVIGGRSQLSVSIVEIGNTPQPSPISDRSSQQLLETPLDSGSLIDRCKCLFDVIFDEYSRALYSGKQAFTKKILLI